MSRQRDRKLNYSQQNGGIPGKKVSAADSSLTLISFPFTVCFVSESANDRSYKSVKYRSITADTSGSDHWEDESRSATSQQSDECARTKGELLSHSNANFSYFSLDFIRNGSYWLTGVLFPSHSHYHFTSITLTHLHFNLHFHLTRLNGNLSFRYRHRPKLTRNSWRKQIEN